MSHRGAGGDVKRVYHFLRPWRAVGQAFQIERQAAERTIYQPVHLRCRAGSFTLSQVDFFPCRLWYNDEMTGAKRLRTGLR